MAELNTYNYIDTGGKTQQFQADTPEAALSGAPGIDPHSGVQLVPPTGNTGGSGTNPIFNTTNGQWADHNNATGALNTFTNSEDPYMQLFQQQKEANALTAGNAIASATADTERAAIKNEQDRNATLAGLATAAEKTGLAPNSAYQLQVIQGAKDQFNTRFALLDQQEKLAIAKAKAAQAVGDTAVLKEQIDYAVKLRKAKADALAESQKLDWEKYKFEHLSAAQRASEARLSSGSKGSKILTLSQIEKFRVDHPTIASKIKFGMSEGEVDSLINSGDAPGAVSFNPEYFTDKFDREKLFNAAIDPQKGAIPRNKWNSKQVEIDAFIGKLQNQIQLKKQEGYSDQEIEQVLTEMID